MPSLPIDLQKNDMIAGIKAGVSHNILHSVFNQGKEQLCKSVKMAEGGNGQRTIREVQQTFGHSLGYANEIIWDLLSVDQAHILKVKIQNLIQDPEVPPGLDENERVKAQAKVDKQKAANNNIRENFFNAIWTQRKYSNLQSLTSIFYVMVATDETDHMAALNATKWSCHPVVRVRRCISICEDSANSSDCCMVFVDDQGRVYQNWSSYVENNELPKGIMVAPRRGVYNLINNVVQLETWVTPVATTKRQVLNAMDTTTAVTGLAAASVPLLGLLAVPVAGPVMAAAGFAALVCGGYGLGRSASQLADRSIHEQSISITDRTARNHWLGVGGGTVALGAAGATTLLTAATNAGREVGAITQLTVNGMNISSIMISGTGLANGIVDLVLKYMDGDDISAMDALQLSASLVLFTHSVYNFKLASTIINETTNNRIGAYRETLSNRQRRMFDKLSKETIRTRGASQGKLDIIRNVNEMPSRKEFNDLYKINKKLNQNGIRPSFDADGKGLLLNNEVKTTGAELRANLQHNKGPDVLGKVTQPIPESHKVNGVVSTPAATLRSAWLSAPSPTLTNQMDQSNSNYGEGVDILRLSSLVCNGVMIALSRYGSEIYEHIVNAESFETALLSLADVLPGETMTFILNMTKIFMENMWQDLYNVLHFYLSSEMVLYRIGIHILDNCREYSITQLNDNFSDILAAVRSYFLSLNPNGNGQERMKCKFCPGYYTTCDL